MNTDNLEYQQAVAEQEAKQFLNSYEPHYKAIINARLVVMDTIGVCNDPETPAGATQAYIAHKYYEEPFTHWEFYRLLCRGSYLTAALVLRQSYEIMVQCKYFHDYPELCLKHLTARRSRDRIPFIKMFDEYCPGFYKDYYGLMLSGMAHGGIAAEIFRSTYKTPESGVVRKGFKFDSKSLEGLIAQMVPILHGFLSHYPVFFPNNTLTNNKAGDLATYKRALAWTTTELDDFSKRAKTERARQWTGFMRMLSTPSASD